ncbi:Os01g0853650 [Oryza sativa Japonica Group]|uniref:Os01g0853650 protein n=1 Tax=Oryza sativa subsp. japonica TaxID=39947 RepID=A0A0N7KE30_ORYSJ|nr:Os01g0853650 [Oryza sativa Japonica Group]
MATVTITRYGVCVEWHRCYCRFVLCSSDFCSCEVEESASTGGGALLSSICSAIGHGRESESIIDAIALLGRHVRPRLRANIQILQMDDIIEE